jgi:hypothetical protein
VDLEKFIEETLLEISGGLKNANAHLKEASAKPDAPNTFFLRPGSQTERGAGIEFDVAVTTRIDGGGTANAKLRLAVVEADLGGKGGASNERVSRIKFTVCVGQWVG